MINADDIIKKIHRTVKSHECGETGAYRRWLWQDETNTRDLGINEYGCADAANILYTIGEFPHDSAERNKWTDTLQGLQNKETGLFTEKTHHPIHTTAHCTAALELFDAKPLRPMNALEDYSTKEGLFRLLENLPWLTNPWDASHQGAGIYAALVLSGQCDSNWCDAYFDWLWDNSDPETGFIGKRWISRRKVPLFCYLAGTFHYLFNLEYARMPLRYPDKVIDTCLYLYENEYKPGGFLDTTKIGFSMVDWVYCTNRASRQSAHRFDECKKALADVAVNYAAFLSELDEKSHDDFNDLHFLFGCTCALAEMQQAVPGMIKSTKPLRLVLDRRPFI